jgi:NAD(P)-dependent dehydrogenase (short-subunit alcohol dehydrogenase family)
LRQEKNVSHPALSANNVAVITGGASGIGLAAATRFVRLGMRVCIADVSEDRLAQAAAVLTKAAPAGAASVMTEIVDVSRADDMARLESKVRARFGGTDVLMNNAVYSREARFLDQAKTGSACLRSTSGASFMGRRFLRLT